MAPLDQTRHLSLLEHSYTTFILHLPYLLCHLLCTFRECFTCCFYYVLFYIITINLLVL